MLFRSSEDKKVCSVILPEASEFTDILRKAVFESRLNEPFILLERKVITTISYEKLKARTSDSMINTQHSISEVCFPHHNNIPVGLGNAVQRIITHPG